MPVLVNPHRGAAAAGFDPLTSIPWTHSYWTEGPEFVALGLANGGAVATFPDEASTNDATQGTAGARPTYQTSGIGAQPSVRFDGSATADFLQATWTSVSSPYTIAIVYELTDPVTQGVTQHVFDGTGASNRHALLTATADTPDSWWIYQGSGTVDSGGVANADSNPHLAITTWDATDELLLDGSVVASGAAGTHASTGLTLGISSSASLPMWGDVAFVAFINRVLTAQEKADLRTWSQGKYGTP